MSEVPPQETLTPAEEKQADAFIEGALSNAAEEAFHAGDIERLEQIWKIDDALSSDKDA